MDNTNNPNIGAPLNIPAPSSSAPPAGPGLWGHAPSKETSNVHAPLGTIPGQYSNLGLNPETGHLLTPPTTSQSARVSGQTEQYSLNALVPGQPPNMTANQVVPPFNLVGSTNTNPVNYPAIPIHHTPISNSNTTSTVLPPFVVHPESAALAVPATSGQQAFDYGHNSGLSIPPLPLPSTSLVSTQ